MNPRRINLALWTAAAATSAAAPAAVWFGLVAPLGHAGPPVAAARPTAATPPGVAAVPSVESFGTTLAQVYRPPLLAASADSSPATVGEPAPSPGGGPSGLQLVGTVGDAVALIRGPDGTTALVEVGDDVDGAAVVAIRPSQVDLRHDGRLTRLQKPPPAPADLIVR